MVFMKTQHEADPDESTVAKYVRKHKNPRSRRRRKTSRLNLAKNYLLLGTRKGLDFFFTTTAGPAAASAAPEAAAEEEGKPTPTAAPTAPTAAAEPAPATPVESSSRPVSLISKNSDRGPLGDACSGHALQFQQRRQNQHQLHLRGQQQQASQRQRNWNAHWPPWGCPAVLEGDQTWHAVVGSGWH